MNRQVVVSLACCALGASAAAQTLGPDFAAHYEVHDLGAPLNVPPSFGGITFLNSDVNVVLLGGSANSINANIYAVRISRESNGYIRGFECGSAQFFADAYGVAGGIDGGLVFGPGGVLFYATYPDNYVGQIKPGSSAPDKLIAMNGLGIWPSLGAIQFVPPGFAGAGRLKLLSFNGSVWYDATVVPDGNGTYDITNISAGIGVGGGPEGMVFVAGGNPGFAVDSILVCEWSTGRVSAYDADSNGDPVVASRRDFMTGLGGAEGAVIDPVTGDFLFSTFGGGNRVLRVSGFTSITNCPGDINVDDVVDLTDLAMLLASFGQTGVGDLDGNCTTDLTDLAILLTHYGSPCP